MSVAIDADSGDFGGWQTRSVRPLGTALGRRVRMTYNMYSTGAPDDHYGYGISFSIDWREDRSMSTGVQYYDPGDGFDGSHAAEESWPS